MQVNLWKHFAFSSALKVSLCVFRGTSAHVKAKPGAISDPRWSMCGLIAMSRIRIRDWTKSQKVKKWDVLMARCSPFDRDL